MATCSCHFLPSKSNQTITFYWTSFKNTRWRLKKHDLPEIFFKVRSTKKQPSVESDPQWNRLGSEWSGRAFWGGRARGCWKGWRIGRWVKGPCSYRFHCHGEFLQLRVWNQCSTNFAIDSLSMLMQVFIVVFYSFGGRDVLACILSCSVGSHSHRDSEIQTEFSSKQTTNQ